MSVCYFAVPVRTVGEQAYRIRELHVRFFRAEMLFKPSPEAADEYLRGVVNAAGRESTATAVPDVLAALRSGVSSDLKHQRARSWALVLFLSSADVSGQRGAWMDISALNFFLPSVVSGSLQGPIAFTGTVGELAESAPSWRLYRQEFLRTMAFGEWETYDHPVACESTPIGGSPSGLPSVSAPKITFSSWERMGRDVPNARWCLKCPACSLTDGAALCRPAGAACACREPCGSLQYHVPQSSQTAADEGREDGAPHHHAPPAGSR